VQVDEIRSLRQAGESGNNIAGRLGINRKTVYSYLSESNMSKLDYDFRKSLTAEQEKDVLSQYNKGLLPYQIAKEYGVSVVTINRTLNRMDYKPRPIAEINKRFDIWQKADSVVALYAAGNSIEKIAQGMGCCDGTITRILTDRRVDRSGRIPKGARSPHWKGGISGLYELVRKSFRAELWRRAVIKRDGRKCRITGRSDLPLEVHHFRPITTILWKLVSKHPALDLVKDVERLAALAQDFAPLWDVRNGITVTKEVHELIHTIPLNTRIEPADKKLRLIHRLAVKAASARRRPKKGQMLRRRWGSGSQGRRPAA